MKRISKKISGRNVFVKDANKQDWLVMQEWFATKPFYELLSLDDILEYYEEFRDGGAYVAEIEYEPGHSYPVSLLSWKGAKETEHPVMFKDISEVAYISDSMTIPSYRKRGIQTQLLYIALKEMKSKGYKEVYLRTVEGSEMNSLAKKAGMDICKNGYGDMIIQITKTPRSLEYIDELKAADRKKLHLWLRNLIRAYDTQKVDVNVPPTKRGIIHLLNKLNELEIQTQDKSFQNKFGKNIEETVDQIMIPELRCFYRGNIQVMILRLSKLIVQYNKRMRENVGN